MDDEKFRRFIKDAMDEEMREIEEVLAAIDADPVLREVQAPPEIREKLFAQIAEYEERKRLANLTDEEKEWIRYGKIYKKRHKWNRVAVLIAAAVAVLAVGTVSIGEEKNILTMLKQMITGGEQTVTDSGSTEPVQYVEEEDVFEKIGDTYKITPVMLEYLPEKTVFQEAIFCTDIQEVNLYYGTTTKANVIYSIRPNYRESSFSTIIEDEKINEYMKIVENIEVEITEYYIEDSRESRWIATWVYEDVQYQLNITGEKQEEIEKIVNMLKFF